MDGHPSGGTGNGAITGQNPAYRPAHRQHPQSAAGSSRAEAGWELPKWTGLMPVRLQRSRRRGARLPAGAIVVTRPTKWGNPHPLSLGRAEAVRRYHDDLLASRLAITVADVQRELRGKDLACYCPLDEPCHADVLLGVANG